MGIRRSLACVGLMLAFAACGGGSSAPADAQPADAGPPADAPAEAVKEAREIISGGTRMTGGSFTVDVEVGHSLSQQQISGGSFVVEGAATATHKPSKPAKATYGKVMP